PDASVRSAVVTPAPSAYIACAVAASCCGTLVVMSRIHARCSAANVRPCSGCTSASAVTLVDDAMTTQRTMPAAAATVITPAGPMRFSSGGPTRKNTTTSAATDSDQSTLAVGAVIPAAVQRITANVSC